MSRIHLTQEEVYDIFRNVFHNENERAARCSYFGANPGTRSLTDRVGGRRGDMSHQLEVWEWK